ncbi:MAG: DUF6794 domain-containing protein [Halopseudomonas sp.]
MTKIFLTLLLLLGSATVWSSESTPATVEEAVVALEAMLSKDQVVAFKSKGVLKAVSSEHFGIGGWVRNNWISPEGSPLRRYFDGVSKLHRDDMSSIVLASFWRHLHLRPMEVKAQITCYEKWWAIELSETSKQEKQAQFEKFNSVCAI